MKVKNEIIEMIRENQSLRRELLYRMEWSEATLYRNLRENPVNGDLTKTLALKIIAEGLGIKENEILNEN
ncbi:MAG: hypothetical protein LBQ28_04715 [Prevotellaceae bacterium]|jgi:DeoR/GlpR family transcriptional regulator of sugar metabolism|nr:hypothetical protein [Prevotellaceae bacterium]